MIHFYRQEPGDLGIGDLAVRGARTAKKTATRMLLRHFNNPNVPAELRPHRARVLTYDELRVVLTIKASGPKTVRRERRAGSQVVVWVPIIVGLAFIGLAALYWLTPAGELPAFLPGYEQGSIEPHFNHGLGALIIGLAALVFAWWFRRRAY